MNKLFIGIPLIVLFVIGIVFGVFFAFGGDKKSSVSGAVVNSTPLVITKENLPSYIASQQIVKDLPAHAIISLRFYNYNSGERQWENSYIITRNSVVEGTSENPDIELTMASLYIPEFKNGFCSTIAKADANKDLGINMLKSKMELTWKYKGLMKYKSCLGL
ncbi:MAG: hypothetical protein WC781_05325 [Candidatus Pacearchaeota archaeon]|jgi:hypothetical protein